jgi:DNA-binding MarR family transcriptional regulator
VTGARRKSARTARAADKRVREARPVVLAGLPQLIGYRLRRAQLRVFQDFIETLGGLDIRPAQFSVLTLVGANEGLRQSEICAALGIKRANLVGLVDELETRELLKRATIASDRRSRALSLTAKGRQLLASLNGPVLAHDRRIARRLGPADRKRLLALLALIAEPE